MFFYYFTGRGHLDLLSTPYYFRTEIEKVKFMKKKHKFLDIKAITSQILKKMKFLKNSKGGRQ